MSSKMWGRRTGAAFVLAMIAICAPAVGTSHNGLVTAERQWCC